MRSCISHIAIYITCIVFNLPCSLQSPHCYVSKVISGSNATLCDKNYFIFPDIWRGMESQDEFSEEDSIDFALCCPMSPDKIRVDEKQFWWPNEINRGLSRGILNCHPANIPGIETIRFLYYTNNNNDPEDYNELFIGSRKALRVSRFVKNAPIKIIIHGFMSSPFVGPAKVLRHAYADRPDVINIIAVHWEPLANLVTASDSICYNIAAQSTKLVGRRTAALIEFLIAENMTDVANIHVLGHSLGAHCAGFTGKFLTVGKLSRITAFDPARPHFDRVSETERIHHTDAYFVDVIHTATKDWKLLGLVSMGFIPFPVGLRDPVGHADFYPNHGTHQPGCSVVKPTIPVLCSHSRSYLYYAESINYLEGEKQFLSKECMNYLEVDTGTCSGRNYVPMGEYTPQSNHTRKLYFLVTNKSPPFLLTEDKADGNVSQSETNLIKNT